MLPTRALVLLFLRQAQGGRGLPAHRLAEHAAAAGWPLTVTRVAQTLRTLEGDGFVVLLPATRELRATRATYTTAYLLTPSGQQEAVHLATRLSGLVHGVIDVPSPTERLLSGLQ
jgi:hypothetical protein